MFTAVYSKMLLERHRLLEERDVINRIKMANLHCFVFFETVLIIFFTDDDTRIVLISVLSGKSFNTTLLTNNCSFLSI